MYNMINAFETPKDIRYHLLLKSIADLLGENFVSHCKDRGFNSDERLLEDAAAVFRMVFPGHECPYRSFDSLDKKVGNSAEALWSIAAELRLFYETGRKPNKKVQYFIDGFSEAGFSLDKSKVCAGVVQGVHRPIFFDLNYKGELQKRVLVKSFTDAKKKAREQLLSRLFKQYGAWGANLDVLQYELLGVKDRTAYLASDSETQLTAEEAIRSNVFLRYQESGIVDSLVGFNVEGAFVLNHCLEDFKREREEMRKFEDDIDKALGIERGSGNTVGDRLREIFDEREIEEIARLNGLMDDLTSKEGKNYISEFKRRVQDRFGVDSESSEFVKLFAERYIMPMMKGPRVLSHNDFHAGNVFENGKILDMELSGYGALGDDLAKYLVSKYTHTGLSDADAQDIIYQNADSVMRFVDRYNSAVNAAHEKYGTIGAALGLKEMGYDEFAERLKGMIMHSAFTTCMQRIADYRKTGDEQYKEVAYANFSIFYSSLDNEERRLFNKEFRDPKIKEFISTYTQKLLAPDPKIVPLATDKVAI